MTEKNHSDFDQSAYERPSNKYICGRAAEWGVPCRAGPNFDGTCGCVAECEPFFVNGRWECRRPQVDGGPCKNGPSPEGICGCTQSPCVPRRTMRWYRGRLSIIAAGIIVALLAAFTHLSNEKNIFSDGFRIGALDAGELTDGHTGFFETLECKTCHTAHESKLTTWLMAVITDSDVAITKACVNCHLFEGEATSPHNAVFPADKNIIKTECTICHNEHKGVSADISSLSDEQCASCHEKKFTNFSTGHSDFSEEFPYFRRTAINFDHTTHLTKYFQDERMKKDKRKPEDAPAECITCHQNESEERSIKPLGYEKICATCHTNQILKRKLVFLRLPEFNEPDIDREVAIELCGPNEDAEDENAEDYESVSVDEMSVITSYLMGLTPDDPEKYSKAFQNLMLGMMEDGISPLIEMLEENGVRLNANQLLTGLNPEAAKRMACAWAMNLEYELPASPAFGGWYGDLLEFIYQPNGHADIVIKRWLDFAVIAGGDNEEMIERAEVMREYLLSKKDGPGACVKCHAITRDKKEGKLRIEWQYHQNENSSYQSFSHQRHLRLVDPQGVKLSDPNQGCAKCHKLNADAAYDSSFEDYNPMTYSSNFISIEKKTCSQCHAKGRIREDCQLCHNYHKGFDFTDRVTRNKN